MAKVAEGQVKKGLIKNTVSNNVISGTVAQYALGGALGGQWSPKHALLALGENMLEEQLIGLGGGLGKAAFWGLQGAQMSFAMGSALNTLGHSMKYQQMQWLGRNLGGRYQDTQQAYTMRQQALKTMQRTGIDVRQTLGSEANFMHRGSYY